MSTLKVARGALLSALLCSLAVPVFALDRAAPAAQAPAAADNADALRKAAQNPVASMISVPIQENWNFGIGTASRVQNVLNVQPVIPVNLSQNWNLIVRWVTPIVYQPLGVNEPPPPSGSSWTMRLGIAFHFPVKPKS
jgi:hypothetical protein